MSNEHAVSEHYGADRLLETIEAALRSAGKDLRTLTVDDLAPVDEFHTRGREATVELAALANLGSGDVVLDVGCGLGGTARFLAHNYGCQVAGVDVTDDYIEVGRTLTEWVGLEDQVRLQKASALELPFDDNQFDVVWTEHVQMNIPDKKRFYSEIARVLRPGGRFLFHDVFRGTGERPIYPVPWAEGESLSPLVTEHEARGVLLQEGFEIVQWLDKVAESIGFFESLFSRIQSHGVPSVGIHLLMGDSAVLKLRHYLQNLREERVTVVVGLAHGPG